MVQLPKSSGPYCLTELIVHGKLSVVEQLAVLAPHAGLDVGVLFSGPTGISNLLEFAVLATAPPNATIAKAAVKRCLFIS